MPDIQYRRARHRVTLPHTHPVFVTTYRRRVFDDAMLTYREHTIRAVRTGLDVELVEFTGEPDHVHPLLAYPPTLAVSTLVQRLEGDSTHALRAEYTGRCNRARMRGHFWSPSYFAVSCGGAPSSIIKQYIDRQARPSRPTPRGARTDGIG